MTDKSKSQDRRALKVTRLSGKTLKVKHKMLCVQEETFNVSRLKLKSSSKQAENKENINNEADSFNQKPWAGKNIHCLIVLNHLLI
jgi:hypothetical protein